MPITAVDRILADHAIRELKADCPFREPRREVRFPTPRNEIERVAELRHRDELDWIDGMERLLQSHRKAGRIEQAAVVARVTAQAYPSLSAPNYAAGVLFLQLKEFGRARRYLERSLLAQPDDMATLRALIRVNRALGDEPRARMHVTRLKQLRGR